MNVPFVRWEQPIAPASLSVEHAKVLSSTEFVPVSSAGLPFEAVPRLLAATEVVAVLISAVLAKVIYLDYFLNSRPPVHSYVLIALCMGVALYLVFSQMGLYDVDNLTGPDTSFGRVVGGITISNLIVLGLLYAFKEVGELSRGWVLVWLTLMSLFIILVRIECGRRVKRGMASGWLIRRIAVIGPREFALSLANRIRISEGLSAAIDLYHCEPVAPDGRFIGGLGKLEAAMGVRPYDRIVIAVPGTDTDTIRAAVKLLGAFTTELLLCTDLTEMPVATSGARQVAGVRADVVHLVPLSQRSALIKRTLDLLLAGAAMLALLPVFLLIALAIKFDSPGPVFFCQRRLGQNGSVFKIFKFRSMTVEEDGPVVVQATKGDWRVTRVGRFLRSTSLDELPQLINVLLGQMSLVGPRPHAIANDLEFEKHLDLFSRRRRVKPGITGWAQVNGFRGETKTSEDIRRRMEHDLYYIDRWSIWFDIEIMIRTLFVLTKGAY